MQELKDIIKEKRIALGLSQDKLGRLINANDAFISRIEHGKEFSIDTLSKISSILQFDLLDLLVSSGYISNDSIQKHCAKNQKDIGVLTKEDMYYVDCFIESLIAKRKSEE